MHLHPPTPKGRLHRSLRVISLLLLQHALVPIGTNAYARMRLPSNPDSDSNGAESRPYLQVSGTLPLRFSPAPRPIPLLPVKAAVAPEATPKPAPATPSPTEPDVTLATTAPIAEVKEAEPPVAPDPATTTPINSKPVLSILPDDTHHSTRSEDFLPFFQFPSGKDVTVVVPASAAKAPAPGQLPASSATYQQR